MNPFEYVRATDLDHAVAAASAPDARIIAGGTNLIDLMKYNVERPARLVDITRLERLRDISESEDGSLWIGALVSNAALAYDDRVTTGFPLVASATLAGATPQLRNAASVGGNLNQRTRCYYFYDPQTPCNKRSPGTGCGAAEGVNRIHAILGASNSCIATHPSDMCVALAALEASVHVIGPDGSRAIPFSEYHRLPGDRPESDNTLRAGEIVTAVILPGAARRFSENYTYLKLRDRLSYAFALVSVAAAMDMEGDVIREARVALGGVAHKPWRRPEAEARLAGQRAGAAIFEATADLLLEGARGFRDNAFKIELARRAIVRAFFQAAAGTPQSQTDKRIR